MIHTAEMKLCIDPDLTWVFRYMLTRLGISNEEAYSFVEKIPRMQDLGDGYFQRYRQNYRNSLISITRIIVIKPSMILKFPMLMIAAILVSVSTLTSSLRVRRAWSYLKAAKKTENYYMRNINFSCGNCFLLL